MAPNTLPSERSSDTADGHERTPIRPVVGALTVLAVAAGIVAVLWLSLTARGFGVVNDAAGLSADVVRELEDTLDTNIIDRSDVPWSADEVFHLVGWGSVTLVVGFLLRARRSLADIAVGVFAASFAVEVLQGVATTSRTMSAEDVSANALGIMLALMVLIAAERLLPVRRRS